MATITLTPNEMNKYMFQMRQNGYKVDVFTSFSKESDQYYRKIHFIDPISQKSENWVMTKFGPVMWRMDSD